MSAPPSYEDVAGPSSGGNGYAHPQSSSSAEKQSSGHSYPSAQQEKHQAGQHQQHDTAKRGAHSGDKVLKIWHAASGNSLITAADEQTPIYNVIDSRAPSEEEQRHQYHRHQEANASGDKSGMERRHPTSGGGGGGGSSSSSGGGPPADVQFAQDIQRERHDARNGIPSSSSYSSAYGSASGARANAQLWHLTVRRGGDRNAPVLAVIKRHVNTKSAVVIEFPASDDGRGGGGGGFKTGIERHSGFPHAKYTFHWAGRSFTWQKTHGAPNTSRLDSGNYQCREDVAGGGGGKKGAGSTVYAYTTSEDDRCDGSLLFEDAVVEEGLLDIMTVTGFVMRDLEDERNNPSYMRYSGNPYGQAGYGPYGNPYYSAGYGFYPYPMLGFPLLL